MQSQKTILQLPATATLRDGREVLLREIREDDKAGLLQAFSRLSADARYTRFMASMNEMSDAMLERATHPDAACEFALVAVSRAQEREVIVGGARFAAAAGADSCEFAVTVADDWTSLGLARCLMEVLVAAATARGYRRMEGFVLSSNGPMRRLARRMGFQDRACPGDATLRVVERRLAGATGSPDSASDS